MNRYFEHDIDKLEILKKGKVVCGFCCAAAILLTLFFGGARAYGQSKGGFPITDKEKNEIVEVAKADEGYVSFTQQLAQQYGEELANGQITQEQYNSKIAYLEDYDFISRVVNSAKIQQINDNVYQRKQFCDNSGKYAVISGVGALATAAGYAAMSVKRKQIKDRWYSEEEGRGL